MCYCQIYSHDKAYLALDENVGHGTLASEVLEVGLDIG